jgi:uncharacterized oxidoreductase
MLTLVFDPVRLGTAEALPAEIARLADWAKASPRVAGCDAIYLPGEPERRTAAERERAGIPMPDGTLDALARAAASLGVDSPRGLAT